METPRVAWIGPLSDRDVHLLHRAGAMPVAAIDPGATHLVALHADRLDALLSRHGDAFDAVLFAGHTEPSALRQAIRAGKHVLVEGAVPFDSSSLARFLPECPNVVIMLGQASRYLPAVRAVKTSLDAGQLGRPGFVRIHRWQPPGGGDRTMLLAELLPDIDLACWLYDATPEVVHAVAREGYVQLHLGFAGGGMALLDLARTLPAGDGYFALSLIGASGAAYVDDHHDRQLHFGGGPPRALGTGGEEMARLAHFQAFVSAVRGGRRPDLSETLRAVQVAEAAARALEGHQAEALAGRQPA